MLVLSRRKGDAVLLNTSDGDIEISVEAILPGGKIRLGFTAPRSVGIARKELELRWKPTETAEANQELVAS